jgi:protein SERAC1
MRGVEPIFEKLRIIVSDCSGVLELHRKFVALYRGGHLKIDVFSFVETALTLMSVLYLRIVGVDSAGKIFKKT